MSRGWRPAAWCWGRRVLFFNYTRRFYFLFSIWFHQAALVSCKPQIPEISAKTCMQQHDRCSFTMLLLACPSPGSLACARSLAQTHNSKTQRNNDKISLGMGKNKLVVQTRYLEEKLSTEAWESSLGKQVCGREVCPMTQAHLGRWAVSGVFVGLGGHVPCDLSWAPRTWQNLRKEMRSSVAVI